MAQLSYGYSTPKGVPGGLYDLTTHEVNSRRNESNDRKLKFGMGVITGSVAGHTVSLPGADAEAASFEGVTVNGFTTEHNMSGEVTIRKDVTVGIMRTGKVWARVADGIEPKYKDSVYLIISGDDIGCFSNVGGTSTIPVKAEFIGEQDNGIAPIVIFNESHVTANS